jgi:hypothetical protein
MGRSRIKKFNYFMKRLDFLYGREAVDEHIAEILARGVDKISFHDLVKVM